ncbi:hypothetical protein NRL37_21000 [Metapseudomonas otitidis]|uniref:hypothetical protein n=1 Tax=Metapseudomonas otitidis TaxID=319939 RepID=UPI00227C2DD2|nr:hypothetical protein [Pseudomonas otitidis]WAF84549.1 hypothetical protein NRL37_21000 [Pseudomonas otitidis]
MKENASYRNEIIIALIGLAGIIFTALISNYDKIFKNSEPSTNSFPYENIDDLDLQLRYFIEISGFRSSMEELKKISAEKYKLKHNISDMVINCIQDNQIQTEQMIELVIKSHKNHITLQQIKELNRLYSSDSMRSYTKSSPLIVRDLLAGLDSIYERMHIRNMAIANSSKTNGNDSCPAFGEK